MVMQWIRGCVDAAGFKATLGFQPSTAATGTIAVPRAAPVTRPELTWMERLDRWFWRQEQKRRDAYLAAATDLVDLEQRMRRLERAGTREFL